MSRRLLPLFAVIDLVMRPGSPWTPAERIVAVCVGNHMDEAGEAWPSAKRIRECTGLCRTAVRRALRALCSGPAAVFERTPGYGRERAYYKLAQRDTTQPSEGHEATHQRDTTQPSEGHHATLRGTPRNPQRDTTRRA